MHSSYDVIVSDAHRMHPSADRLLALTATALDVARSIFHATATTIAYAFVAQYPLSLSDVNLLPGAFPGACFGFLSPLCVTVPSSLTLQSL